jgi:cobaltochelatase CobN
MATPTRIALVSTSDTDLLSARASGAEYVWANPSRADGAELAATVAGADLVVVRCLGSPHDLWPGLAALREDGTHNGWVRPAAVAAVILEHGHDYFP